MAGPDEARGSTLACGFHAVEAALRRSPPGTVVLYADQRRQDTRMRALLDLAVRQHADVRRVAREHLEELAGDTRHQGVLARHPPAVLRGAGDPVALAGARGAQFLALVLDGVQDPRNLGACLRTAAAAGADCVVVPRDRACPLTPAVGRVAAGAAERVPLARVTNLARTMEALKEAGVWLIGADAEATESLYAVELDGPLALVLGAEGGGLRALTRRQCDRVVQVPMASGVESLNVAVAAGVCLFEIRRRRMAGGAPP